MNDRRLELLAERDELGVTMSAALIDAYVTPLAEQVAAGTWYVPFLSRLQAEHQRDELLEHVNDTVNTAYLIVRRRLRNDHLRGLSADRFAIRWRIALNLAIDALADYQAQNSEAQDSGERRRASIDTFREELVGAIAAMLTV